MWKRMDNKHDYEGYEVSYHDEYEMSVRSDVLLAKYTRSTVQVPPLPY